MSREEILSKRISLHLTPGLRGGLGTYSILHQWAYFNNASCVKPPMPSTPTDGVFIGRITKIRCEETKYIYYYNLLRQEIKFRSNAYYDKGEDLQKFTARKDCLMDLQLRYARMKDSE